MLGCSSNNQRTRTPVYLPAPQPAPQPVVQPVFQPQPQIMTTQGALKTKSDLIREGMTKDEIRNIVGPPDNVQKLALVRTTWRFSAQKCLVSWGRTGFRYQTTFRGDCAVDFDNDTGLVTGWTFGSVSGASTGSYCVANCPAGVTTIQLPIESSNGYIIGN